MKYFLCIALIISVITVEAQSSRECVQKVRKFGRKMTNKGLPADGIVRYVNFTSKTVMWDSINTPSEVRDVKMWLSKDHMQYVTKEIEVYQDKSDAFMIVHPSKKVIWGQSQWSPNSKETIEFIASMQDTLFDLSNVSVCETFQNKEGKSMRRLVLKPNKEGQEMFHISLMEYVYDDQTGAIEKVNTTFLPVSDVKRISLEYKAYDEDYKKLKLNKPYIEKILNGKNELATRYNGYQLIDNR